MEQQRDNPFNIDSSQKVYKEAEEMKEETSTTEALMKEQLLVNYVRSQKIERKDLAEDTLLSVSEPAGFSEQKETKQKAEEDYPHDTKEVSISEVPPIDTALLRAADH